MPKVVLMVEDSLSFASNRQRCQTYGDIADCPPSVAYCEFEISATTESKRGTVPWAILLALRDLLL